MRETVVWIYFATLLLVPLTFGCEPPTDTGPNFSDGFCGLLLSTSSPELVVDGCPIHVEDVEASIKKVPDLNVTPQQLKEAQTQARETAVQDVRLFQLAERNGYLKRPEVQQKVMSYIARSYLQESSLEGKISDDQARLYYEKNIDEFTRAERRIGRHILIPVPPDATDVDEAKVKEEIRAIHLQVQHNIDKMEFAKLAVKKSHDRPTADLGGLMEATTLDGEHLTMDPELAKALFALKRPGDVSSPVRTSQGWHLVQLAGRVEGRQRSYEQVRNMVRTRMRTEHRDKLIRALLDEDGAKSKN